MGLAKKNTHHFLNRFSSKREVWKGKVLSSDKYSKEMFIFQSHKEFWTEKKKKKEAGKATDIP